jgi:hypothetical protein
MEDAMPVKPVVLFVTMLCVASFASNQLTFSKDTVHVRSYNETDSLRISNRIDSLIVIDSICFKWKIGSVTQKGRLGMNVDTPVVGTIYPKQYVGYFQAETKKGSDTSFFFTKDLSGGQIMVRSKNSINLVRFLFGTCLYCAGVAKVKYRADNFYISAVFVNNRKGRDSVCFTGPVSALFSSGTVQEKNITPKAFAGNPSGNMQFSLLGRKRVASEKTNSGKKEPFNLYISKSKKIPGITKKNLK